MANSKGFSSVIGTTFMVLVMMFLGTSVFLWTLSQNTLYNEAVREKNQLEVDRLNERVKAFNAAYAVTGNDVSVSAELQNQGPLSVHITNLWVMDVNTSSYNFSKSLSVNYLQPGGNENLTDTVTIIGSVSEHRFSSWLITGRGNVVPLEEKEVTEETIIRANVTQGIGSISFNFEQFWHYDFNGVPDPGTTLPSASHLNYTISASNYTVYHVVVTNLDPLGKDIVLNGNSSIYIICAHGGGTVKYGTWGLVNVTANKIYPGSPAQYSFKYGNTTEIYFAGKPKLLETAVTDTAYPLNVLLLGRKGNNDYGQNIPFVSIYLVP